MLKLLQYYRQYKLLLHTYIILVKQEKGYGSKKRTRLLNRVAVVAVCV